MPIQFSGGLGVKMTNDTASVLDVLLQKNAFVKEKINYAEAMQDLLIAASSIQCDRSEEYNPQVFLAQCILEAERIILNLGLLINVINEDNETENHMRNHQSKTGKRTDKKDRTIKLTIDPCRRMEELEEMLKEQIKYSNMLQIFDVLKGRIQTSSVERLCSTSVNFPFWSREVVVDSKVQELSSPGVTRGM